MAKCEVIFARALKVEMCIESENGQVKFGESANPARKLRLERMAVSN